MCKEKKCYESYAKALDALFEKVPRPELGSAYECPACGGWHISSRRFTLTKPRGRGKMRKGVLYE